MTTKTKMYKMKMGILKRFKTAIRIITYSVITIFLFEQLVWAQGMPNQGFAPQIQIPDEPIQSRSIIDSLVIPEHIGKIKTVYEEPLSIDKKVILHIQDSHANYEAQMNIAKILEYIATLDTDTQKPLLIAVEGAKDKVDTSIINEIDSKNIRYMISNYFMENGLIDGAEFYSAMQDMKDVSNILIWGVEDKEVYIENRDLFKRLYQIKPRTKNLLAGLNRNLAAKMERNFTPEQLEFIAKLRAYHNDDIGLEEYAGYLRNQKPVTRNQKSNYEMLIRLIELKDQINFERVEQERMDLIKELKGKLVKEELMEVISKGLYYQVGRITAKEYFRYLGTYIEKMIVDEEERAKNWKADNIGISDKYKNLINYIDYVKLESQIDRDSLFRELAQVEKETAQDIFSDAEDNLYYLQAKHLLIIEKFLELKIYREDLYYYKENKKDFLNLGGNPLRVFLTTFERFCDLGIKRDEILVGNTLNKMEELGTDTAILITGGFHTEGITKLFTDKEISHLVISPRMTEMNDKSRYTDLMLEKKSTLDKILLFTGTRIKPAPVLKNLLANIQTVLQIQHEILHYKDIFQNFVSNGKRLCQVERIIGGKQKYVLIARENDFPEEIEDAKFYLDLTGNVVKVAILDSPYIKGEGLEGKRYAGQLARKLLELTFRQKVQRGAASILIIVLSSFSIPLKIVSSFSLLTPIVSCGDKGEGGTEQTGEEVDGLKLAGDDSEWTKDKGDDWASISIKFSPKDISQYQSLLLKGIRANKDGLRIMVQLRNSGDDPREDSGLCSSVYALRKSSRDLTIDLMNFVGVDGVDLKRVSSVVVHFGEEVWGYKINENNSGEVYLNGAYTIGELETPATTEDGGSEQIEETAGTAVTAVTEEESEITAKTEDTGGTEQTGEEVEGLKLAGDDSEWSRYWGDEWASLSIEFPLTDISQYQSLLLKDIRANKDGLNIMVQLRNPEHDPNRSDGLCKEIYTLTESPGDLTINLINFENVNVDLKKVNAIVIHYGKKVWREEINTDNSGKVHLKGAYAVFGEYVNSLWKWITKSRVATSMGVWLLYISTTGMYLSDTAGVGGILYPLLSFAVISAIVMGRRKFLKFIAITSLFFKQILSLFGCGGGEEEREGDLIVSPDEWHEYVHEGDGGSKRLVADLGRKDLSKYKELRIHDVKANMEDTKIIVQLISSNDIGAYEGIYPIKFIIDTESKTVELNLSEIDDNILKEVRYLVIQYGEYATFYDYETGERKSQWLNDDFDRDISTGEVRGIGKAPSVPGEENTEALANWLEKRAIDPNTKVPASFEVLPEDAEGVWKEVDKVEGEEVPPVDAIIERMIIKEGASWYDIACSIIASLNAGREPTDIIDALLDILDRERLGEIELTAKYREGDPAHPFKQEGLFFRLFPKNGKWLQEDPIYGDYYEGFPNNNNIHWEDWRPIAGENAWIVMMLMHIYAKTRSEKALRLAKKVADALIKLQAENGGIRMAPEGTWHERGTDFYYNEISTENNLSCYSVFRMLAGVTGEQKYRNVMDGIERYLKSAFDSNNRIFYQGMHYERDGWTTKDNTTFAVDCQTWAIAVLGPEVIDNWFGEGTAYEIWQKTKNLSKFYEKGGVGFSEDDVVSVEWTCGAILAVEILKDYYPSYEEELSGDLDIMNEKIASMRRDLGDDIATYPYADKRVRIPFGWNSPPVKVNSRTSTAWRLMNLIGKGINPFYFTDSDIQNAFSRHILLDKEETEQEKDELQIMAPLDEDFENKIFSLLGYIGLESDTYRYPDPEFDLYRYPIFEIIEEHRGEGIYSVLTEVCKGIDSIRHYLKERQDRINWQRIQNIELPDIKGLKYILEEVIKKNALEDSEKIKGLIKDVISRDTLNNIEKQLFIYILDKLYIIRLSKLPWETYKGKRILPKRGDTRREFLRRFSGRRFKPETLASIILVLLLTPVFLIIPTVVNAGIGAGLSGFDVLGIAIFPIALGIFAVGGFNRRKFGGLGLFKTGIVALIMSLFLNACATGRVGDKTEISGYLKQEAAERFEKEADLTLRMGYGWSAADTLLEAYQMILKNKELMAKIRNAQLLREEYMVLQNFIRKAKEIKDLDELVKFYLYCKTNPDTIHIDNLDNVLKHYHSDIKKIESGSQIIEDFEKLKKLGVVKVWEVLGVYYKKSDIVKILIAEKGYNIDRSIFKGIDVLDLKKYEIIPIPASGAPVSQFVSQWGGRAVEEEDSGSESRKGLGRVPIPPMSAVPYWSDLPESGWDEAIREENGRLIKYKSKRIKVLSNDRERADFFEIGIVQNHRYLDFYLRTDRPGARVTVELLSKDKRTTWTAGPYEINTPGKKVPLIIELDRFKNDKRESIRNISEASEIVLKYSETGNYGLEVYASGSINTLQYLLERREKGEEVIFDVSEGNETSKLDMPWGKTLIFVIGAILGLPVLSEAGQITGSVAGASFGTADLIGILYSIKEFILLYPEIFVVLLGIVVVGFCAWILVSAIAGAFSDNTTGKRIFKKMESITALILVITGFLVLILAILLCLPDILSNLGLVNNLAPLTVSRAGVSRDIFGILGLLVLPFVTVMPPNKPNKSEIVSKLVTLYIPSVFVIVTVLSPDYGLWILGLVAISLIMSQMLGVSKLVRFIRSILKKIGIGAAVMVLIISMACTSLVNRHREKIYEPTIFQEGEEDIPKKDHLQQLMQKIQPYENLTLGSKNTSTDILLNAYKTVIFEEKKKDIGLMKEFLELAEFITEINRMNGDILLKLDEFRVNRNYPVNNLLKSLSKEKRKWLIKNGRIVTQDLPNGQPDYYFDFNQVIKDELLERGIEEQGKLSILPLSLIGISFLFDKAEAFAAQVLPSAASGPIPASIIAAKLALAVIIGYAIISAVLMGVRIWRSQRIREISQGDNGLRIVCTTMSFAIALGLMQFFTSIVRPEIFVGPGNMLCTLLFVVFLVVFKYVIYTEVGSLKSEKKDKGQGPRDSNGDKNNTGNSLRTIAPLLILVPALIFASPAVVNATGIAGAVYSSVNIFGILSAVVLLSVVLVLGIRRKGGDEGPSVLPVKDKIAQIESPSDEFFKKIANGIIKGFKNESTPQEVYPNVLPSEADIKYLTKYLTSEQIVTWVGLDETKKLQVERGVEELVSKNIGIILRLYKAGTENDIAEGDIDTLKKYLTAIYNAKLAGNIVIIKTARPVVYDILALEELSKGNKQFDKRVVVMNFDVFNRYGVACGTVPVIGVTTNKVDRQEVLKNLKIDVAEKHIVNLVEEENKKAVLQNAINDLVGSKNVTLDNCYILTVKENENFWGELSKYAAVMVIGYKGYVISKIQSAAIREFMEIGRSIGYTGDVVGEIKAALIRELICEGMKKEEAEEEAEEVISNAKESDHRRKETGDAAEVIENAGKDLPTQL